jgi:putative membrane protein
MKAGEVRKPQSFSTDDPALRTTEPLEWIDGEQPARAQDAPEVAPPTLGELGERGLRWGKLLFGALTGAALLAACASFARLVSTALAREDWIGWTTLALLLIAAFAALMLVLREVVGLARFRRLNRLRSEAERALSLGDRQGERRVALALARLYGARPELRWSVARFREHARDVHDAGELIALAEREMLGPLDVSARRLVMRAAKRVATVTALSPMVLIAVGYVAVENLRLLRALAGVYGGRPGIAGLARLANLVLTHLIATGGLALTDDLLGQFLGQDVLRRLSRRLGEGAFNGALTARIGLAALTVVRPLPHRALPAPRARDVLADVLRPIAGRKQPPA